jgi:hypothetical protein
VTLQGVVTAARVHQTVCDVNTDTFPDFVYVKGRQKNYVTGKIENKKTVSYNKTRGMSPLKGN